jgi:thiol:disulfide interchange protein
MARTDQRALPVALIAVALVLVAARVAAPLVKRDAPKAAGAVQWLTLAEGLALAATTGKPILFDFTADWCQPCHMLDEHVFGNPAIAKGINERFVPIRVVDRRREEGRNAPEVDELQQRFGVRGFPTVVFADRGGERARVEGFRGPDEFERVMESVR